jgi:hypothetical protein
MKDEGRKARGGGRKRERKGREREMIKLEEEGKTRDESSNGYYGTAVTIIFHYVLRTARQIVWRDSSAQAG